MRTPTIAWWSRVSEDMPHSLQEQTPQSRVSQYVGTQMDFLPTFAELAGVKLPPALRLDGESIASILQGKVNSEGHPVYFYRGNILYAVRWEQYKVSLYVYQTIFINLIKAHFWTWTTPPEELKRGKIEKN